ncbi:MAG TPA: hypothetical protein VJ793_19910 [Anaerolineae bacterium]|nr:hypothetical protein [Anaerolineae bacterium]
MSTPFDIFKDMLLQAAGDAIARRGYTLQDDAIQVRSGLYRFARPVEGGVLAFVDVQLLFYSGGGPSRFEVKVWRSDRPNDKTRLGVWLREQAVETLADDLGWWEFASGPELEESLRDAVSGLERMWNEK